MPWFGSLLTREIIAHAVVLSTLVSISSCSPTTLLHSRSDPSSCRLPSIDNVYLSVGHGFPADLSCVPSTGTMKAFMIFVDFSDQPSGNDTTGGLYDFFFPNASTWYETSSYGKLSIDAQADKSQFLRMPKNASEYAWNRGITYEQHEAYIQDALDAYEATGAVLSSFDVLYVVASRNSPAITYSPTFMGNVTTRSGAFVAPKAVTVGYDAYTKWGYKLINHETGHVMCLADLYPATGAVGLYVGDFNIMGNINAGSPDYFAWDKWRLGWLSDDQVECIGDGMRNKTVSMHTIYPLEKDEEVLKVVVLKKNETQAMVLEARAGGGVDDKGAKPGVVVYSIDTAVATLQGSIRVLPEAPLSVEGKLAIPSWGVEVSIIGREGDAYLVRIETGFNSTKISFREARDPQNILLE